MVGLYHPEIRGIPEYLEWINGGLVWKGQPSRGACKILNVSSFRRETTSIRQLTDHIATEAVSPIVHHDEHLGGAGNFGRYGSTLFQHLVQEKEVRSMLIS